MADGDERAVDLQLAVLAPLGVRQEHLLQGAVVAAALEAVDRVGRQQLDVVGGLGTVEHHLRRAELIAAVDDLHVLGELGQEGGVLHGGVAAADHDGGLVAEEGGVAGGAVGHAAGSQLVLTGHAQLLGLGAHGQDHAAGQILLVAHVDTVHAAVLGQIHAGDVVGHEPRPEALGLVAEALHHLRAHDPLGVARVVLHVGGLLEQAAPREALEDQGVQVGARGVQRSGVARGATADDDHVFGLGAAVCFAHVASVITLLSEV